MILSKSLIREFRRPDMPIPDLWIPPKINPDNLPKIDDPEAAVKAIRWFQDFFLIHEGVKDGDPFTLASWMWEAEWIINGMRDPDGLRTIRDVSIIIPKKNAKSPYMAAKAAQLAGFDGEPGAKVAIVASSSDQADCIYKPLLYACENHELLKKRFKPFYAKPHYIEYYNPDNPRLSGMIFKRTGEPGGKQGRGWSGVLADEISEWHGQKGWELWRTYTRGSGRARRQPLKMTTTTGNVFEEGSFYQSRKEKTLDSIKNPGKYRRFHGIYYGPTDSETKAIRKKIFPSAELVARVNPGHDEVFPLARLMDEIEEAFLSKDPTEWPDQERYTFNLDINAILQWMPHDVWGACAGDPVDIEKMAGRDCYVGIDLANIKDISTFAILFAPKNPGDKIELVAFSYLPEDRVNLQAGTKKKETDKDGKEIPVRQDNVQYLEWVAGKFLTLTKGPVNDNARLIRDLIAFGEELDENGNRKHQIDGIGYDPNRHTLVVAALNDAGYGENELWPIVGNYGKWNEPSGEFMKLCVKEQVHHGDNPLLNWAMLNLQMKMNEHGYIKPVKGHVVQRIDPAVAVLMAFMTYFWSTQEDYFFSRENV